MEEFNRMYILEIYAQYHGTTEICMTFEEAIHLASWTQMSYGGGWVCGLGLWKEM